MEVKNDDLGVSFTLPDKLSVFDQLQYKSLMIPTKESKGMYNILWLAAKELVDNWKCKSLKIGTDLKTITDPAAADIVEFVGLKVFAHYNSVEKLPKD